MIPPSGGPLWHRGCNPAEGFRERPRPLYAVLEGHPPMTPRRGRQAAPRRPRGARAPGGPTFGLALGLAGLAAVAAVSGCALQSEVMEVQDEMDTVKSLQKQLEQQIADAQEAAETMRAIGFRMEAVETKLREGINPEVQARITQGLHDLDGALSGLDAKNKAIDDRLADAERFFSSRVEEVSAREQALSQRLSGLETSGLPPAERSARDQAAGELEVLKTRAEAEDETLKRMQGQFGLLTDRLAQLQAAQQAARQQAAGAGPEKVDLRLSSLEAGAAKDAQGRQQLGDQMTGLTAQVAALTGQVAALSAGQQDKTQVSETQAAALEGRLAAAEKQAAESAAAMGQLSQKVDEAVGRMAGIATAQTAGATEATGAVQTLAGRLAALEKSDADARAAERRLTAQVDLIAQRVGDLAASEAAQKGADVPALEARVAHLEGGKGQVERLAQLTDQLTLLGSQVTERLDAQAGDFTRMAGRLDRIEKGVQGFQDAPPPWGEALDKKVSFLADELTPRVDTQGRELTAMAQTLATGQEAEGQSNSKLAERIDTLGTSLVQRVEGLEARVKDAEAAADARAKAQVPPDLEAVNRRLDVLGREMPKRVDDLTQVVGALRGHLQQVGERISLLETIQKQEAADLRERFNALSTALGEISGSKAP